MNLYPFAQVHMSRNLCIKFVKSSKNINDQMILIVFDDATLYILSKIYSEGSVIAINVFFFHTQNMRKVSMCLMVQLHCWNQLARLCIELKDKQLISL